MHRLRFVLLAAVVLPISLTAKAQGIPTIPALSAAKAGLAEIFPETNVGQTSTLQCLGLCFRQNASPAGSCDAGGTITLEDPVAAPFSINNLRRGSANQCGGSSVTLPTTLSAGQALWFDARFAPTQNGTFADSLTLSGFTYDFTGSTGETPRSCAANATTLCVNGGRFAVTATWATPDGQNGVGRAVALTADTGYFSFFSDSNAEVVLKVLDACGLNQRFWVFAGGLTNVRVDLTVRDTRTGAVKTYRNPQNTPFLPIQDTGAFSTCSGIRAFDPVAQAGTPTGTTLSVQHGRFRITSTWRANGQQGAGQAVQLSDETGYFWFFSPDNVEMLIKVLDGCGLNQRFWVFAGGLTNTQVDITVLDTVTQATRTYHSAQGTPFQQILDTSAFASCASDGLPPDPGEAGRQTLPGIDSDHDGLRDDLQRYIALTYSGAPATVTALRETARVVQGAILDNASTNSSLDHATALARSLECLHSIRPGDAATAHLTLISQALNTEARGLAFLASNDKLGGAVFPIAPVEEWASSCDAATRAELAALGQPVRRKAASTCQRQAAVFFGNGVWNTCAQAQASADELALAVRPSLTSDERSNIFFGLACNPTRGLLADVWRAGRQYFADNFSAFYAAMTGITPMPNPVVQILVNMALILNAATVVDDPALQDHLATYRSFLLQGQKVVVVSHSQGNFYANLASGQLASDQRDSFGIVAVASPSDHVAGNWGYTTLKTDRVITPIPHSLPWNVDNGAQTAPDLTGHQFVQSYLAPGSTSRGRIVQQVVDEIHALPEPNGTASYGVVTITLTWNGATDVDLHVFEPGGAHVYYAAKTGDSGFLDVDDISGFGPEHYYVGCNQVQTGTYRVGVNYFSGFGAETAHIVVAAGLSSKSFDIVLPSSRGSSGDDDPVAIADIVVTGNATAGYDFEIRPRI